MRVLSAPSAVFAPLAARAREVAKNDRAYADIGSRFRKNAALSQSGTPVWLPPMELCHDAVMHVSVHIGEAEVAAAVAEREFLVVHAYQVQQRGVQIVHVHAVIDCVDAE